MHIGRAYQYANIIRVLGVGQWDWPAFPAKQYDLVVPRWADQLNVNPAPGTHRTDDVVYTTGDRFATWTAHIPCKAGHTVDVVFRIELTTLGIGIEVSGKVIVDGSIHGTNGTVTTNTGPIVQWGNWTGPILATVAPQNLGSDFPAHIAAPWH